MYIPGRYTFVYQHHTHTVIAVSYIISLVNGIIKSFSYFAATYHKLLYRGNKYLTATAGKINNRIIMLQLYFTWYKIVHIGR